MESITATEARKEIYNLLKAKKRVEIKHKNGTMVMIPKEEFDQLERESLAFEMDHIIATQEKFTSEEVNAMLATVMDA